jgi:hypothetical protein
MVTLRISTLAARRACYEADRRAFRPGGSIEGSGVDQGQSTVSTIRFARFDTTLLLVCGRRDPSPRDWALWTEAYADAAAAHDVRRLFVVSAGGGPDARQRKQVIAALASRLGSSAEEIATAACGNAPSVRIITAAVGWLSGAHRLRSFRGDERVRALTYLKVPDHLHREILRAAERFEAELVDVEGRATRDSRLT